MIFLFLISIFPNSINSSIEKYPVIKNTKSAILIFKSQEAFYSLILEKLISLFKEYSPVFSFKILSSI